MKCPTCQLDCKDLNQLSRHLSHSLNHISTKDYYDEYLKSESDGMCLICGTGTKFECLSRGYYKTCSSECKKEYSSMAISESRKSKGSVEKFKHTCLEKYGVENPFQLDEVKKKYRKTCLEKYGTENPNQYIEIQNKTKQTCLEKYGVENVFQSEEIKDKIRITNIQKYGVPFSSQNSVTRKKYRNTCTLKYGVDNISQTFEMRKFFRERFLGDLAKQKNNGLPIKGRIGDIERQCLNELQMHIELKILRNAQFIGYIPDGRIEELKLIIEFDEHWHNHTWARKHDSKKDLDYYSAGYGVFRIKLKDWIHSKDLVISNFKNLIMELELERKDKY